MKMDKTIKGKFELDEAYFDRKRKGNRGRGAKNTTIVFGILERKGTVRVEIVKCQSQYAVKEHSKKSEKKKRCVH